MRLASGESAFAVAFGLVAAARLPGGTYGAAPGLRALCFCCASAWLASTLLEAHRVVWPIGRSALEFGADPFAE